jgi:hypothetical protein
MADYFTQFSCFLDVGTPENAARALALYNDAPPDQNGAHPSDGFRLSWDETGGQLWFHDDGFGDPERVIAFVLRCAEEFNLQGLWGFEYANTCSKPRLDAFGGGAHVIDLSARKSIASVNTNEWLYRALRGEIPDE